MNHGRLRNCVSIPCKKKKNQKQTKNKHKQNKKRNDLEFNINLFCFKLCSTFIAIVFNEHALLCFYVIPDLYHDPFSILNQCTPNEQTNKFNVK